MPKLIFSAYVASPCALEWNPSHEELFYRHLWQLPSIGGLELPFLGESLHPYDERWLFDHLKPDAQYLVTCIPGTMQMLKESPQFGLASCDDQGRRKALEFTKRARDAIVRLNRYLGREAVGALVLQSAPSLKHSQAQSSGECLLESLKEISSWNWGGTQILLEHCDAFEGSPAPIKGFLRFEDEIKAVESANNCRVNALDVGFMINWARSVIESRDIQTPVHQASEASRKGLLKAVFFSGVTQDDAIYGQWLDTHAPFATAVVNSLMTEQCAANVLSAAKLNSLDYLGLKIQLLPHGMEWSKRWAMIQSAWAALLNVNK